MSDESVVRVSGSSLIEGELPHEPTEWVKPMRLQETKVKPQVVRMTPNIVV